MHPLSGAHAGNIPKDGRKTNPFSPDVVPTPRLVFWETTGDCNLRCVHCRREWEQAPPEELDTAGALALVDQIADANWGSILVLSGGEPLMRKDIFAIIERASSRSIPLALATNGTLVDDALASRLAKGGVLRASVSLDGADAKSHDDFRGEVGSFEGALRGIKALQGAGIPVQINCTFTKRNLTDAKAMLDLAESLGAVAVHVFLLVPVGCGLDLPASIRLEPKEVEHLLTVFDDEAFARKMEIRATCAPQSQRIRQQRAHAREKEGNPGQGLAFSSKGCLAGGGILFVDAVGKVFPCGYLPVPAGDIHKQTLHEIVETSPLLASLRDTSRLEGRCGDCDYSPQCGGCRARSFGSIGDLFGEEPSCPMPRKDHLGKKLSVVSE